jgi:hypothetical protein
MENGERGCEKKNPTLPRNSEELVKVWDKIVSIKWPALA